MSLLNHSQQHWKNLGSQVFLILSRSETFRPDVTTVTSVESSVTSAVVLLEMSGNSEIREILLLRSSASDS